MPEASFENDQKISRLFSLHYFLDPLDQFLDPQAHFPDDPDVKKLTPNEIAHYRTTWSTEVKSLFDQLIKYFEHSGIKVDGDNALTWEETSKQIVSDWLRPIPVAEKHNTTPGAPQICLFALREFLGVKENALKLVPAKARQTYKDDFPALTIRWMIEDAKRSLRTAREEILAAFYPFWNRGASFTFTLILSFIPVEVFQTILVRNYLQQSRGQMDRWKKRYQNPLTRLNDDSYAQTLISDWNEIGPMTGEESQETLKKALAGTFSILSRDQEEKIWRAMGLDKSPTSRRSGQTLWDCCIPLLHYLKPYAPLYKIDSPSVIPDSLFTFTSQLLHARYPAYWEDKPDRLKQRFLRKR